MAHVSPVGAVYVETDGSTSSISFTDKLWYKPGVKGELTLHCAIVDFPASGTATIYGKDAVGMRLQLTSAGILSFVSIRSGGTVTTTATVALTRGTEYILHGVDNGSTVKLYVNGTQVGTTGTSASGLLTTDTNPYYLANDIVDVVLTKMRLYGWGLRLDDEIVGRWRVVTGMAAVVPDRSSFHNDAAIAGAVLTGYFYASAWQSEPAYAGRVTL